MKNKDIVFEKFAYAKELSKFLTMIKYTISLNKGLTTGIMVYIVGLISIINPTANMATDVILGVSHDTITRAICTLHDNFQSIILFFMSVIQAQTPVSGWLIIDDVLLHKENSKHTDYVFKIKDHTTGKYVYGIQIVVLLWSNGIVRIPLGFKVYLDKKAAKKFNKTFKTKLQLAQELLESSIISAIPFDFITFDTWYSSKDLLKFIQSKGLKKLGLQPISERYSLVH
ncbi:MAG: transposase [Firmicutes bacterium]|nr:transposase [Bacillota bacterium]